MANTILRRDVIIGLIVSILYAVVFDLSLPAESVVLPRTEDDEIFRHYRPLAMDESWSVTKTPTGTGDRPSDSRGEIHMGPRPALIEEEPMRNDIPAVGLDNPTLVDVEESSGLNISQTLFKLPKRGSAALTKLITGKEEPTFVHNGIIRPIINPDKSPNSKILASYKIMVPIWIPAVEKKKATVTIPQTTKYVQETHTKLIPIEKNIPEIKTYYKAERVPQKIITDYVKADGNSVPSYVDDRLMPDEKLIKSVVSSYS